MLTTPAAHILCLGLFTADHLARAWRIQVLARGLGRRTRFLDAFTLNAASDATAALTPLKVGGEPTRFGGLVNAGLNVSDTIALISVESILEWLVVLSLGGWIGVQWGGEWWRAQQHTLIPHLKRVVPWALLTIAIGFLIWFLFRRFLPKISVHVGGTLRDSLRLARRMHWWAIIASLPLTIAHVVARIAILPVILATLPDPPALGTVVVGSFALLYGQNFVPTPSGAGAIELGFLNGAAGYVGPEAAALLVMWRFYTTLLGIALGLVLGFAMYLPALHRMTQRFLARRRAARHTVREPDAPG